MAERVLEEIDGPDVIADVNIVAPGVICSSVGVKVSCAGGEVQGIEFNACVDYLHIFSISRVYLVWRIFPESLRWIKTCDDKNV